MSACDHRHRRCNLGCMQAQSRGIQRCMCIYSFNHFFCCNIAPRASRRFLKEQAGEVRGSTMFLPWVRLCFWSVREVKRNGVDASLQQR